MCVPHSPIPKHSARHKHFHRGAGWQGGTGHTCGSIAPRPGTAAAHQDGGAASSLYPGGSAASSSSLPPGRANRGHDPLARQTLTRGSRLFAIQGPDWARPDEPYLGDRCGETSAAPKSWLLHLCPPGRRRQREGEEEGVSCAGRYSQEVPRHPNHPAPSAAPAAGGAADAHALGPPVWTSQHRRPRAYAALSSSYSRLLSALPSTRGASPRASRRAWRRVHAEPQAPRRGAAREPAAARA